MSNASQSPFCSKLTESRSQLLCEAALSLFDDGVIAHPSNAAIAKYDERQDVASYVCLFHDWHAEWAHLKYNDIHLAEELQLFQGELSKLADAGNTIAGAKAREFLGKTPLEQLTIIGEQLKTISFYLPATSKSLATIRATGKSVCITELNYQYLFTTIPQRSTVEASAGKPGHWSYGVELEQVYLCTKNGSIFGEYFFREKDQADILAITAACSSRATAHKLANLDSVFRNHRAKFTPLKFTPPLQAATKGKAPTKAPQASVLIARIPPGTDHEEKLERENMVAEINGLTDTERQEFSLLAPPIPHEKYGSLGKIRDALEQLRKNRIST